MKGVFENTSSTKVDFRTAISSQDLPKKTLDRIVLDHLSSSPKVNISYQVRGVMECWRWKSQRLICAWEKEISI